jgi:phosphoglycerate dehydrogenase-like enzyme
MRAPLSVHATIPLGDEHLARIRAVSPHVHLTHRPYSFHDRPAGMDSDLRDVEVLFSHHARFEMAAAPRLRWLQLGGAGVDHLKGAPVLASGILITNAHIFAVPISEYVIASVLAFHYRFPQLMERFQKGRIWPENPWLECAGNEVAGKTMAVIGFGSIGRAVARLARCLGMSVVATRRSRAGPAQEDGVRVYPPDRLREVLAEADAVVVCLPLTTETEGLIGQAELGAMKPHAYLVNIGRGKVIQEAALLTALREGWIGGAGLDAHAQEPLPTTSPFFDLPNVILTPHMSGISTGYPERITSLFCENLRRYLAGEMLLNIVDKQQGY